MYGPTLNILHSRHACCDQTKTPNIIYPSPEEYKISLDYYIVAGRLWLSGMAIGRQAPVRGEPLASLQRSGSFLPTHFIVHPFLQFVQPVISLFYFNVQLEHSQQVEQLVSSNLYGQSNERCCHGLHSYIFSCGSLNTANSRAKTVV